MTRKLHKNPKKARLVIAAPKSSLKLLSKDVKTALKLKYKQIENYNSKRSGRFKVIIVPLTQ